MWGWGGGKGDGGGRGGSRGGVVEVVHEGIECAGEGRDERRRGGFRPEESTADVHAVGRRETSGTVTAQGLA